MPGRPAQLPVLFNYVGSKWKLATSYPPPRHGTIVEPFAGSAGYSCRYGVTRDVILVESSPHIAAVWKWLLTASRKDVLGLPLCKDIPLDGLPAMDLPPGARNLIGLNLARAIHPLRRPPPCALGRNGDGVTYYWNATRRTRLADAVRHVRHWRIIEGNYDAASDVAATWFIDPPYQDARLRKMYKAVVPGFDYAALAKWCRSRKGQVIACDVVGADWLPFKPLTHRRRRGYHLFDASRTTTDRPREAIWCK